MKAKKILLSVILMMIAMVLILSTNTFAATGRWKLGVVKVREGETFKLDSDGTYRTFIKNPRYSYQMRGTGSTRIPVLKIVDKTTGIPDYSDAIYCLKAGQGFGSSEGDGGMDDVIYDTYFDMVADKNRIKGILGITSDSNYNSILWLLDNIYLPKQYNSDSEKGLARYTLLGNAFNDLMSDPNSNFYHKTPADLQITDDDIEVVQQWALWHFTNKGDSKYSTNTLPEIFVSTDGNLATYDALSGKGPDLKVTEGWSESIMEGAVRAEEATALYKYLIEEAAKNYNYSRETTVIRFNDRIEARVEQQSILPNVKQTIAGPFELTKTGNTDVTFLDELNEVTDEYGDSLTYTITDEDGNNLRGLASGARLKDVVGKGQFYIKVTNANPKTINLKIKYTTTSDTTATLWTVDGSDVDQPVVVVEKKPTTLEDETSVDIKEFDLALRKYIKEVKRNNVKVTIEELDGRFPEIDKRNLKTRTNGKTATTAKYTHRKDPVPVQTGDIVKYAIEIFNEGEIAGRAGEIIDYLPTGLEFIEPAEGFSANNYTFRTSGNQLIITAKNKTNTMLDAYDGLDLHWVTIEFYCRVTKKEEKESSKDTILTNIAEITKAYDEYDTLMTEEGDDRDSKPNNLRRPTETDLPSYKGNTSNKDNLTDKDYFYKGQQDDDDFEKLKVTTPEFDLSLRKFITKVGDTVITDRAPVVDTTPLKNGEETAIYKHKKEPITVNAGTLVEYTIRVYNEGELAGYPTIIEDYLPEELEFVEGHPTNEQYEWRATGRIIRTQYVDKAIPAYNETTDKLSFTDVKIVCKVKNDAPDEKVLTNIAQIMGYSRADDRDSEPDGFRISDSNLPNYRGKDTGADQNITDLTRTDYYYKGQEDDDDFEKVKVKVYKPGFDLALRKFITKIGDSNITDRVPSYDTTPLKNKTGETAIYTHPKNPLTVNIGDLVEYTIRVYNEGESNGYATMVEDYLPEELEFVEENQTNKDFGWKIAIENGIQNKRVITTDYLKNRELEGYKGGDVLSFADVKIVCRVKETENAGKVLTNIAQINADTGDDRDSTPGNVRKPSDKNLPNYNEHQEDDDDFEKVKIYQPEYDLSLRKFITKVNGKNITDRIPTVDTTPLTNGSGKTTAIYTHPKTPVLVRNGDIVEYTIRIYNEGKFDAYAQLVKDNIPEGLGFVVDNETNVEYLWRVSDDKKELSTNYLSKEMDEDNVIKAFDPTTMNTLDYKDVKVVFKVLEPNTSTRTITNIAEIKDDDGNDIDSIPDNDKPGEDDIDVEHIKLRYFDLALRKFITKVESKTGENLPIETDKTKDVSREPKVEIDKETGKIKYVHPKDPVNVANSDIVIYTLRVYNEGTVAGFANEIKDDVPVGLELVPNHEINKKYGWVMYDEEGKVTSDVTKAKTIRTTYLSEEKDENNIIPEFNRETMQEPAYKEVQVAFKVVEKNVGEERVVINTAEISKDSDDDEDSTPDNDEPDEDDIDKEFIKLKYFDLSLLKWVNKVMVTEKGVTKVTETGYNGLENPEPIVKLELKPSQIDSIVIKYEYGIKITNEGEIAGYAKEVADYIPEGLEFIPEDNPLWTVKEDGKIVTTQLENTLLQPGESAIINVVFKWKNGKDNMGIKENWAEISKDENDKDAEDIDSIPDNKKPGEDDIDNALVILSPKTGKVVMFVVLPTIIMMILAGGIILIKKYVM